MEPQGSSEFTEPICDGGIHLGVVINQPEAVTFCGACFNNLGLFNTWH